MYSENRSGKANGTKGSKPDGIELISPTVYGSGFFLVISWLPIRPYFSYG